MMPEYTFSIGLWKLRHEPIFNTAFTKKSLTSLNHREVLKTPGNQHVFTDQCNYTRFMVDILIL